MSFHNTCFALSGDLVTSPKLDSHYSQIQLPLTRSPSAGIPRLPLIPFTATTYLTALLTLSAPNSTEITWLWFPRGKNSVMLMATASTMLTGAETAERILPHCSPPKQSVLFPQSIKKTHSVGQCKVSQMKSSHFPQE